MDASKYEHLVVIDDASGVGVALARLHLLRLVAADAHRIELFQGGRADATATRRSPLLAYLKLAVTR